MRQLSNVSSRFGAPMGRPASAPGVAPAGKVSLYRVRLDRGGYDAGGAYWGIGAALWRAEDASGEYVRHVRAASRAHAAETLGITAALRRPLTAGV